MNKFYQIVGALLLLGYLLIGYFGVEFGNPRREVIPPSVRQSPGGYRSFHFWHSGYSGGK